ncbi:MAG: hypothetical protein ACD_62C00413G0001, partial [uncultured bacterium]
MSRLTKPRNQTVMGIRCECSGVLFDIQQGQQGSPIFIMAERRPLFFHGKQEFFPV